MTEGKKEPKPYQDVNVYVCTGRLTGEPKERGETTVFGFVVHNVETMEGDPVEVPNFIDRIVTFGVDAENCLEYLKTGREVQITGKLCINREDLVIEGKVIFRDKEKTVPAQDVFIEVLADHVQFRR